MKRIANVGVMEKIMKREDYDGEISPQLAATLARKFKDQQQFWESKSMQHTVFSLLLRSAQKGDLSAHRSLLVIVNSGLERYRHLPLAIEAVFQAAQIVTNELQTEYREFIRNSNQFTRQNAPDIFERAFSNSKW